MESHVFDGTNYLEWASISPNSVLLVQRNRKRLEQRKVFYLLRGINGKIRANVLSGETLPSLGTVFSLLRHEETLHKITNLWVKLKDPPYSKVLVAIKVEGVLEAVVEAEVVDVAMETPHLIRRANYSAPPVGRHDTKGKHVEIWLDAQGKTFQGQIQ
ncbi:hypothetical protein AMTR_s00096p00169750 [Amborella trichopoda]|uniref:Uncharacterized protein n=1 Tax=Amborella trichopoda TaxID=13333 RepID=W1P3F3_AMBTC|nr:hypothetical protein AMTR_s00096p00169750 [Amborella trichopoda]